MDRSHRLPHQPGRPLRLPQPVPHHIAATPDTPVQFSFVCFDPTHFAGGTGSALSHILVQIASARTYRFPSEDTDWAPLVASILHELADPAPFHHERASALLADLLVRLYRTSVSADAHHPEVPDAVRAIVATIDRDPTQPFRIEDAAREAGLSRTLFTRYFRTHTGTSAVQYVQSARIRLAMRLFAEETATVAEVAWRSGIPNTAHFHRLFQRHLAMTHRAFRELVRRTGAYPPILDVRPVDSSATPSV
jgi:AraC-like DNA-binding protein